MTILARKKAIKKRGNWMKSEGGIKSNSDLVAFTSSYLITTEFPFIQKSVCFYAVENLEVLQ